MLVAVSTCMGVLLTHTHALLTSAHHQQPMWSGHMWAADAGRSTAFSMPVVVQQQGTGCAELSHGLY